MSFWPGLAGLWLRGRWVDLATAVGFATLLNGALVTTLVWPQWVSGLFPAWAMPAATWVLVLWFWVISHRGTRRILAEVTARSAQPDGTCDELLIEAQTEYLKGHLVEAEGLLVRLLGRCPGDAEARLLLASVHRRGGQLEEARRQLAYLGGIPAVARWQEEIAREIEQLSRPLAAESSAAEADSGQRRAA